MGSEGQNLNSCEDRYLSRSTMNPHFHNYEPYSGLTARCFILEPEPPQPPRGIQVELINYHRMDYQISWEPPQPPSQLLASPGISHPSASNSFSRYRVMWAPRKDEPVDAAMYNDEAGFSPIPDLQHSDVRVVEKVRFKCFSAPSDG